MDLCCAAMLCQASSWLTKPSASVCCSWFSLCSLLFSSSRASIIWLITLLFVLLILLPYGQWVLKFLTGLRDEYDQVRCRILNIDSVPSLREAFAIIQNEESRRVMLPPIPSERSVLVSVPHSEHHHQPTRRDSGLAVGIDDKDKLHCDYCK
ncbi:hypothetical protein Acr_01g0006250 [Actinidia rufa]|uniref:Uncharacterized protein n=1 Tax=Actinidia rufa TaxID=165716 RepID=A0A7J0E3U1_9ERIC|nr:hypothetical protein Acr_01g0006250 [Actinidia rufa]